jgi:hypothetical protein
MRSHLSGTLPAQGKVVLLGAESPGKRFVKETLLVDKSECFEAPQGALAEPCGWGWLVTLSGDLDVAHSLLGSCLVSETKEPVLVLLVVDSDSGLGHEDVWFLAKLIITPEWSTVPVLVVGCGMDITHVDLIQEYDLHLLGDRVWNVVCINKLTKEGVEPVKQWIMTNLSRDTLQSSGPVMDLEKLYQDLQSLLSSDEFSQAESVADFEIYMKDAVTLSHGNRLRLFWTLLRKEKRKQALDKIFQISKAIEKEKFHETRTYFWIQMIHFAIERKPKVNNFKEFLLSDPQLCQETLFSAYYSEELWGSEACRTSTVVPDLKMLPSILPATTKLLKTISIEDRKT